MTHILIQIWRWLKQPRVWRFVGFTSAVIGLLCYALSSSFNYLFGEWNLLKIILYSIFSFIISLMILFANLWQHSRSLRFKVHTAFLVLTITSLYSFFFDKVMKGKPDAYSLISCASFAIMSLSLSKQTQCGFEIDLLYFFLGCLIVQLMKIKLLLFFLGAGFSYLITVLRSLLSPTDDVIDNEHTDDLPLISPTDDVIDNEHTDDLPLISPTDDVIDNEHTTSPLISSTDDVIDNEQTTSLPDKDSVTIDILSHSSLLASNDIGSSMREQLSNYDKAFQQENSNLIEMKEEPETEEENDELYSSVVEYVDRLNSPFDRTRKYQGPFPLRFRGLTEREKKKKRRRRKKKEPSPDPISELVEKYRIYNPYMTTHYHHDVQSMEENPNACIIC